jgi:uncharacterized repeat protein (TIGR04052 family)
MFNRLAVLAFMAIALFSPAAAHEGPHGSSYEGGLTTIHFSARVGELDVACGITYEGLGSEASSVTISDFRLYVSDVRLLTAEGEEVSLELEQDSLWQLDNVALLDFEDGSSTCSEIGNNDQRSVITGTLPEGEYSGLVFNLGVPFELNHLDVTTAASPLNVSALWWNWQFGYKFARIDLMADGEEPWPIHLGSTGCEAAIGTIPPEEPCAQPNLVEVRLDEFDPRKDFVVADLAMLVEGVNLSESTPEPPGCMSMPMDPDCGTLFTNFGVTLGEGTPLDVQNFFRVQ